MNKIACIFLYLDPGTGSMLIQFLIAAVFAVMLFFKQIILRIKYIYKHFFRNKNESEE
jgi:hypothetical protein